MKSGNIIGEMAFFTNEPRSASIRATDDSVLYSLSKKDFEKLEQKSPQTTLTFQEFIIQILSSRIAHMNKELALIA